MAVFTVWKYLVGGIYQRDLKLKSVKISVQGPFNVTEFAQAKYEFDGKRFLFYLL